MSSPCSSACSPWGTIDDVRGCGKFSHVDELGDYVIDDPSIEVSLKVASDLLFQFTSLKYPGNCRDVVHPCQDRTEQRVWRRELGGFGEWQGVCGCNQGTLCGCSRLSEVYLGAYPVTGINEVLLCDDSNPAWPGSCVLDPSLYRVDDWLWLVREPNPDGSTPGWPCCSALSSNPDTDGTFRVDFNYGRMPSDAGVAAAATFAGELAMSCSGDGAGCSLPQRVTSITRQGVTMVLLDPFKFFENGRTGIYSVDAFIAAENPTGRRAPANISSPDESPAVRRVGT